MRDRRFPGRWGRPRGWLVASAVLAALATAPPAARAQEPMPSLEELLENAKTAEDSIAITEDYRAARVMRDRRREERGELRPVRETRGEAPTGGGEGQPPAPDPLYERLVGQPDTAEMGEGAITYRGRRLVFYPQTEVIVLQGDAAAEQAATQLSAERILYRPREGVVEAFEGASVARGQAKLTADSLYYERGTDAVATFGLTDIQEEGSQTQGTDVVYDLERRSGRIGGGRTVYQPWILDAAQMNKVGASTFMLSEGYFTTCELEDAHYTFRSDEIKLRQDDVIVARPVVLYFSDIPVFYLPWWVEPVIRGRSSGFLRPAIGISTLLFGSGRERNVRDLGYYWAINRYADAKVAADVYTESRFILRGDLRYQVRHEFRGDLSVEQVWNRLDDSSSRRIRYSHSHTFGLDSRASVDVNWSNSRRFLRRNSFDPDEILQRSFRSAGSYSTRFDWGSLVAGANADFQVESDRIDFELPNLRLSINQRPLWGAPERGREAAPEATGDRPWYERLRYSANASFLARLSRAPVDSLGNPLGRIPTDSLGNEIETERETVVNQQRAAARFSLNGPLDFFGVINTTPSLTYNTTLRNDQLAEEESFGGQGRLTSSVNMNTRFFRIFRSVPGPWFTAMRHTVSPTVGINYSPEPHLFGSEADADGFGGSRESFTASFNLTNDFEVKVPVRKEEEEEQEEADGEEPGEEEDRDEGVGREERADEGADVEEEEADQADEEEEEQETRVLRLLSVVNSLSWDIREELEAGQIGLGSLSTRLTSDLGRAFDVTMSFNHELVEQGSGEDDEDSFSPFLRSINTDFSIRGQGGGVSVSRRRGVLEGADRVVAGRGGEEEDEEARQNLAAGRAAGTEGFGPWSLSLTHSWNRTRSGQGNRQSLGIRAQMLPSPNWSLNYRTTYNITDGELQGQTLSLVRDLHDWQANLSINLFPSEPQDRVLISFQVYLREIPDLEVPYRVRRE
ncbi:MAG: putative LPS assembly protein LptD [Gemmatimonadota bacterium]|nr:putative LPS assembly protein LptD [Gemmatimonadota bacterium]